MSQLLEALRLHKPLPKPRTPSSRIIPLDRICAADIDSVTVDGEDFMILLDKNEDEPPVIVGVKFGRTWFWSDDLLSQCLLDALHAQYDIDCKRAAEIECECCGVHS